MIWNPFRSHTRKTVSDEQKTDLAESITELLKLQLFVTTDKQSMDSEAGGPKRKAIGYVYGFVDAVLRTQGLDMADTEIGIPILFHVIRRLWPGKEREYMTFLAEHLSDPIVTVGCMHGGQQYFDSRKSDLVPMGLASYIITEV